MEKVQRTKRIKYNEEKEDRLSDLPDRILHHIMGFMDTKYAVQTTLLSKRWNNLWSSNPILRLHDSCFGRLTKYSKFVSWVLSRRDGSISLQNLDFHCLGRVRLQLLSRLTRYAVKHKIQQLNISVSNNLMLPPCIFSCHSLTKLKIEGCKCNTRERLPKSLDFPMLTTLHLEYVTFSACENGFIEPFPNCPKLSLILASCILPNPIVLTISAPQLTNLTKRLSHPSYLYKESYKFMLSTPNLSSFVLSGFCLPILCGDILPLLDEAAMEADVSHLISDYWMHYPKAATTRLMDMFQFLANVRSLRVSPLTLKVLSQNPDLLND